MPVSSQFLYLSFLCSPLTFSLDSSSNSELAGCETCTAAVHVCTPCQSQQQDEKIEYRYWGAASHRRWAALVELARRLRPAERTPTSTAWRVRSYMARSTGDSATHTSSRTHGGSSSSPSGTHQTHQTAQLTPSMMRRPRAQNNGAASAHCGLLAAAN